MNKNRTIKVLKINSISSIVMISVFGIFFLIFFFVRNLTGDWHLEIWGLITIFLSVIYGCTYQMLGGYNQNSNEDIN